ncbi:MAG: AGC protein kinase [Amphiamblys sp. WSBS2006]|nr:MAG: AGC protein kinase [Amphiamblys sp. WSBS2006]
MAWRNLIVLFLHSYMSRKEKDDTIENILAQYSTDNRQKDMTKRCSSGMYKTSKSTGKETRTGLDESMMDLSRRPGKHPFMSTEEYSHFEENGTEKIEMTGRGGTDVDDITFGDRDYSNGIDFDDITFGDRDYSNGADFDDITFGDYSDGMDFDDNLFGDGDDDQDSLFGDIDDLFGGFSESGEDGPFEPDSFNLFTHKKFYQDKKTRKVAAKVKDVPLLKEKLEKRSEAPILAAAKKMKKQEPAFNPKDVAETLGVPPQKTPAKVSPVQLPVKKDMKVLASDKNDGLLVEKAPKIKTAVAQKPEQQTQPLEKQQAVGLPEAAPVQKKIRQAPVAQPKQLQAAEPTPFDFVERPKKVSPIAAPIAVQKKALAPVEAAVVQKNPVQIEAAVVQKKVPAPIAAPRKPVQSVPTVVQTPAHVCPFCVQKKKQTPAEPVCVQKPAQDKPVGVQKEAEKTVLQKNILVVNGIPYQALPQGEQPIPSQPAKKTVLKEEKIQPPVLKNEKACVSPAPVKENRKGLLKETPLPAVRQPPRQKEHPLIPAEKLAEFSPAAQSYIQNAVACILQEVREKATDENNQSLSELPQEKNTVLENKESLSVPGEQPAPKTKKKDFPFEFEEKEPRKTFCTICRERSPGVLETKTRVACAERTQEEACPVREEVCPAQEETLQVQEENSLAGKTRLKFGIIRSTKHSPHSKECHVSMEDGEMLENTQALLRQILEKDGVRETARLVMEPNENDSIDEHEIKFLIGEALVEKTPEAHIEQEQPEEKTQEALAELEIEELFDALRNIPYKITPKALCQNAPEKKARKTRKFKNLGKKGTGRESQTYKVQQEDSKKNYLLKVPFADFQCHAEKEFGITHAARKGNPFVVSPIAMFGEKEHKKLLFEYLGTSLSNIVESEKLEEAEVKFYAAELVAALVNMHRKRIYHGDLTLDNIRLDNGHVKIIDFGNAEAPSLGYKGRYFTLRKNSLNSEKFFQKLEAMDIVFLGGSVYQLFTKKDFPEGIWPHAFASSFWKTTPHMEKLGLPDGISPEAKDFIWKCRSVDALSMLNGKLKDHPWFKDIDWTLFEKRGACPPYLPSSKL